MRISEPVKSAARVLQVMEFFDARKSPATVVEIAAAFDWPTSSTSLLMRSLVNLGYMRYDSGPRTYLPSMRVALLGEWLRATPFPNSALVHLMEELNRETGETIVLATQNQLNSQYIRVVQGTNIVRMHVHTGAVRPLVNSGTGRALLTLMTDAEVRKLIQKHNSQADPSKQVEADQVLQRLALDRQKGYALSMHTVTPYSGVIAMVLPNVPGQQPLAIGIAGLSQKLQAEELRYVQLLRSMIARYMYLEASSDAMSEDTLPPLSAGTDSKLA